MAEINSGIKAYADALFSLTEELGNTEAVLLDVKTVKAVLGGSKEYLTLLDSPALSR